MRVENPTGWLTVLVAFLALSASFSARSILGLTMPLWESEMGWSRSLVSSAGALALVTTAMVAPFTGAFVDRYGARPVLVAGLLVVAAAMAVVSQLESPVAFLLVYGILAGAGFGIIAMHVVSTVVAQHFEENRGLATGIATAGATSGQLILIPALALVLTVVGWRFSYLALGALALLLVPVVLRLIKKGARGNAAAARGPQVPLRERLRHLAMSSVFHALFWSYFICGFTTSGTVETHLLPYAAACGFPPLESATAYGVLSAFNLGGMLLAGFLTDRMHRPLLLGLIYIVRGLSFLLLMQIVGDIKLLFVFAVVFGLADYSTVPVTASIAASHLGMRTMGLTMGLLAASHQAGGAVGAFLGGVLFDLFAQYEWVWTASVILAVSAGFMCFTIGDRGRNPAPAPAAA